jgi:hypothetical protein
MRTNEIPYQRHRSVLAVAYIQVVATRMYISLASNAAIKMMNQFNGKKTQNDHIFKA